VDKYQVLYIMTGQIPLILGDSHGNQMSKYFGAYASKWEDKVNRALEVVSNGKVQAEFILLNEKSDFFCINPVDNSCAINPCFHEQFKERLKCWSRCYVMMDGNIHNAHFAAIGEGGRKPFDIYMDEFPDKILMGRQIVPKFVVENIFLRYSEYIFSKLVLITKLLPEIPVAFVSPPPPVFLNELIKLNWNMFDTGEYEVNDPFVRLKMYTLYTKFLEECCRRANFVWLPAPKEAIDPQGFLWEKYCVDATHAHPDYYELVELQMDAVLK